MRGGGGEPGAGTGMEHRNRSRTFRDQPAPRRWRRAGRCGIVAWCLQLTCVIAASGAEPAGAALQYVPGSTRKLCQLTGDLDRQTGRPTLSLTRQRAGVVGTDLGSSFEHKGKLFFLFGDTHGRGGDRDAIAWTDANRPDRIELRFLKAGDGKWRPLSVPGVRLGAFEVPSHGVSVDGTIYVVFTTQHSPRKTMGRSILAASRDDGAGFRKLHDLSGDKFINVALWKQGEWLYVFGSGDYRRSSVCLARTARQAIGRKEAIRYLAGPDDAGKPAWSRSERDAAVLFRHDVVGELSVAYCTPIRRFVMLYNSSKPRGIVMRSAARPWGPWSEAVVVFDPWRDKGYGHFMHIPSSSGRRKDSVGDPGRDATWGGEYGPYLMARYTVATPGGCRIYYTMSTWNPYQVVVMQSDLRLAAPGPKAR
jgi:hypothetical protein